jgi:hypothetical protein
MSGPEAMLRSIGTSVPAISGSPAYPVPRSTRICVCARPGLSRAPGAYHGPGNSREAQIRDIAETRVYPRHIHFRPGFGISTYTVCVMQECLRTGSRSSGPESGPETRSPAHRVPASRLYPGFRRARAPGLFGFAYVHFPGCPALRGNTGEAQIRDIPEPRIYLYYTSYVTQWCFRAGDRFFGPYFGRTPDDNPAEILRFADRMHYCVT